MKKCQNKLFDPSNASITLYNVRCCSEHYFTEAQRLNGCSVWANSKNAERECSRKTNFAGAEAFCAAAGARVCTCDELLNKCAKGTGCGLNKKLVWCTSS